FLRPEHLHLRHGVDGRDALRDEGGGGFVDGGERQRGRGQRQVEDGLIGRVDLLVGGRRRHLRRKLPLCLGDGRLHVLRGRVDGALQAELQGDLGGAELVGGGHRVQ